MLVDVGYPGDERLRFVEAFAAVFVQAGLERMPARVLALLMVSDPPGQATSQLVAALGASKGAISMATRLLIQVGMIERFHVRGSREAHFRMRPGLWGNLLRQRLALTRRYHEMAERGLTVPGLGSEARARLAEMRDATAFFERELPALLVRWEQERKRP